MIVDECRRSGGMAEPIITALVEEAGPQIAIARVTGDDSYIPLAPTANLLLPSKETIVAAAVRLVQCGASEPSETAG